MALTSAECAFMVATVLSAWSPSACQTRTVLSCDAVYTKFSVGWNATDVIRFVWPARNTVTLMVRSTRVSAPHRPASSRPADEHIAHTFERVEDDILLPVIHHGRLVHTC